MISPEIRQKVLLGDAAGIRLTASSLGGGSAESQQQIDLYELVADLSESDFESAIAKIEMIEFSYLNSKNYPEIKQVVNSALAQVAFAHGKFDLLDKIVEEELYVFESGNSKLTLGEILQLLRLKAGKLYILNEFKELRQLVDKLPDYRELSESPHLFYFINSIKCLSYSEKGEFRNAIKFANININLAKKNKYSSLFSPLDALYVKADSLFAMSDEQAGFDVFLEIKHLSHKVNQWPWYFKADGQIARQTAFNNNFSDALSLIREERELNASFKFENGLSFLPDANELFIRYLIKDVERIEVLLKRLPELTLVKQLRALKDEWEGKDVLSFIKNLPFETSREKIYKLCALAEYHHDNETSAVNYMYEAMTIVEETGATEFLLRQHKLFDIVIKAVAKNPTPYQEDIVRKITERVKVQDSYAGAGLPDPLTKRELEILRHLATKKTTKSVGETLNISMNTMKTHVRHIYQKLDVDTREKAIAKAQALFLI